MVLEYLVTKKTSPGKAKGPSKESVKYHIQNGISLSSREENHKQHISFFRATHAYPSSIKVLAWQANIAVQRLKFKCIT